jgi:preprotein translocase subunit SecF
VRENLRKPKRVPLVQVLNEGINETMSRTIMTASTTLLAVLALFILGGEVLRGLSFILFFGIIIGTYSTIYVASSMVLYWQRKEVARDLRTEAKGAGAARPKGPAKGPSPKSAPPKPSATAKARRSSI